MTDLLICQHPKIDSYFGSTETPTTSPSLTETATVDKSGHLTHLICDIIHHNGCLGTSVVHGSQTVVALLTSCVPDFKLDCCVVQTYRLSQKGSCTGTKQRNRWQLGLELLSYTEWVFAKVIIWEQCPTHTHSEDYLVDLVHIWTKSGPSNINIFHDEHQRSGWELRYEAGWRSYSTLFNLYYFCQGGYGFTHTHLLVGWLVGWLVCWFVGLSAGLHKNYWTDFNKIWWRKSLW